jgi:manganese/zinc/iron transport system substrate-binding protein
MKAISALLYTILKKCPQMLLLLACCCWVGCENSAQGRLTIVATTNLIGDAVKNIVQDHAEVITLMGPGVDPHAYKATQQEVKHLLNADIVFYNGLHLEGKMADILHKLSKTRPVYAAGEAITPAQQLVDPNFSLGIDPHFWFDVCLWKKAVQYISNQLQAADPEAAACYRENTAHYLQQLDELHQETLEAIQQIPAAQRVLITAHDAFGYFGRAYSMEVRGLQGISTVAECGLKDVTDLVKFIIQRNIKAIFLETSVPERPLQAVVEGCRKRGHQVAVGGYLYSDTLGQEGTPTGSYYGMIQANVQTIVNALK